MCNFVCGSSFKAVALLLETKLHALVQNVIPRGTHRDIEKQSIAELIFCNGTVVSTYCVQVWHGKNLKFISHGACLMACLVVTWEVR